MGTAYRRISFAMRRSLSGAYPHFNLYRVTTDRWRRGWQCEWDGCQTAVRACTWLGAFVKACRAAEKQAGGRP